jgi:hypothetical protein
MDEYELPHRRHLFTLRLWREELGAGQAEWRGQVQYVLGGERHSFRDWSALVSYLEAKLQELDEGGNAM